MFNKIQILKNLKRSVNFWLLFLLSMTVQAADLSMSVSVQPAQGVVNQELTYTVTLFPVRVGTSKVVNSVVFSYGVPSGLTVVSAKTSAPAGKCALGNIVECELGNLDTTQTVTLVVKPTKTGSINGTMFASGTKLDETTGDIASTKTSVVVTTAIADPPPIQLNFSQDIYQAKETDGAVTITVSRTGDDDRAISVDYNTTNGTAIGGQHYLPAEGTLTWAKGDKSSKTFTISLNDNRVVDKEKTVNLVLNNPTDATLGRKNAVLKIIDDETTGQIEFSTVNYRITKDAGKAVITVIRNGGADTAVTVNYKTSDGSAVAGQDYENTTGNLYWADRDNAPKTFEIKVLNNAGIRGDRNLTLLLTAADASVLGQSTATLLIVDQFTSEDAVNALTKVAKNPVQREIAQTVGTLCQSGKAGVDLQARCRELVLNAELDPNNVSNALQQLAPEEYAVQGRMAVEYPSRQARNINSRLVTLRGSQAPELIDISGLQTTISGTPLPTSLGVPSTQALPTSLPSDIAYKYGLQELGLFVNGDLTMGSRDKTDRENGFDLNSSNITIGLDKKFKNNLIVGAAFGYGSSKADLTNSSSIKNTNSSLSLYMTFYEAKKFFVDAVYSYSRHDYKSARNIYYQVADTVVNQTASASPTGQTNSLSISTGYQLQYGKLNITPTLRFDHVQGSINSFREGLSQPYAIGNQLGVEMDNQSLSLTTLGAGAIFAYPVKLSWAKLLPELHLEYVGMLGNKERTLNGRFIYDKSGQTFRLPTDAFDKHYTALTLGVNVDYGSGQMGFIHYQTYLGRQGSTYSSIMGGLKVEFD